MFKFKDPKFNLTGTAKWVGLIGGTLAIVQAIIAFWPESHELSIQIPGLEIFDSKLRLSVVFRNTGGHDEIVKRIGIYFVEDFGILGKENNVEIAEFDRMILLDSKKSTGQMFQANLTQPQGGFDPLLESGKNYSLVARFSIVSENGDFATESLQLGTMNLTRVPASGTYQGTLDLMTAQKKVDFGRTKTEYVKTSFPRTTEFDLPELEVMN